MFKEGISSIFAKKKTKSKEAEEEGEDSSVTAILDVFGNGQVGSTHHTKAKRSLIHSQANTCTG